MVGFFFRSFPGQIFINDTFSLLVHEPKMWDNLKGQFMSHIAQVNEDLKAVGRPPLGSELQLQQ